MASVINTAVESGAGFSQQVNAVRDVFSAEIFFAALPILKWDQFTTKKTELGVQPGRTINMLKYGNIKRGGPLVEGTRMQTQAMSLSSNAITVVEYGNAVGFSEMLLQTSFYDQLAAASMLLGRDLAIVLDISIRDVVGTATSVIYGGAKTARNQLTAGTDLFDTRAIKDGVETLETANVPKWMGDHYVCFLHPHQARGLRDDNDWINAALYAGATAIYTGEIGRYEDVRFVSTTIMPNGVNATIDANTGDFVDPGYLAVLDAAGAGTTDVFRAIMFGEYTCGHAVSLPVELRDNGVTDYGREHGLAWFSIFGNAILEDSNAVLIETA